MEFKTKYITTTKQARYAQFGELSDHTKFFWFALHGSKMLCEQMIYKFKDFDPEEHLVIAPEALSRFYLKGFGGDVVATWMTKRDRLKEIDDFSNYLSSLYNHYAQQLPGQCKKNILAFSQGVTTTFRWLHARDESIDNLIAYSGWIPEDINLKASKTKLTGIKLIYTYGLEDEFLTPQKIEALSQIIKKNELIIPIYEYKGGHKIDRAQLMSLFKSHIQ